MIIPLHHSGYKSFQCPSEVQIIYWDITFDRITGQIPKNARSWVYSFKYSSIHKGHPSLVLLIVRLEHRNKDRPKRDFKMDRVGWRRNHCNGTIMQMLNAFFKFKPLFDNEALNPTIVAQSIDNLVIRLALLDFRLLHRPLRFFHRHIS